LFYADLFVAGSGAIELSPARGPSISIPLDTVNVSNNIVTITPGSQLSTVGMAYTVTMAMGVIMDESNNKFAGLSGAAYGFTVKDTTPPTVDDFSPAKDAYGVDANARVVLTFSENVKKGMDEIP